MSTNVCLVLALIAQPTGPGLSADQFERIVRAEQGKIKDFALIYEGEYQFVGPRDIIKGHDPEGFGRQYQGLYYYRNDGAELIDVYTSGLSPTSLTVRYKKSVLRDPSKNQVMFSQAKMISDLGVEETTSSPGDAAMLSGPESPYALLFLSLFRSIEHFQEWGFEFQSWDIIDGRKCARIKLNWGPGTTNWYYRMWIDIGRGCHPIRVEYYREGRMTFRLDQVELKRFVLTEGGEVWLPVKGRIEGFEWARKPYSEPVTREEISVVNGSVLLNQGLTDVTFKVGPTPKTPVTTRLEQHAAGLPLRKAFLSLKPDPPHRADSEGIQQELDAMLKTADGQAERLEASSAARASWNGTTILQYVLITFGSVVVLASGAILLLSRRSR